MDNQFTISFPEGLITSCGTEPEVNISLLLDKYELEQVRAALVNGRRKALAYLDRTKKPLKRIGRGIDINNIDMSLYKAEHCKPKSFYPLELHTSEVETLIYCLEHSGKSKSKDTQQLIAMLYACLE